MFKRKVNAYAYVYRKRLQLVFYVIMALQISHFLPMLPVLLAEELLNLKAIGDVMLCGATSFFAVSLQCIVLDLLNLIHSDMLCECNMWHSSNQMQLMNTEQYEHQGC